MAKGPQTVRFLKDAQLLTYPGVTILRTDTTTDVWVDYVSAGYTRRLTDEECDEVGCDPFQCFARPKGVK